MHNFFFSLVATNLEYRGGERQRKRESRRSWARDNKQRRRFLLEELHENFVAAVTKWEMLMVTNARWKWGQWKKEVNLNTNDISFKKRVTKTFLEVSRCRGAKQWQRMYKKKCAARAKLLFLLISPIVFFFTVLRRCLPAYSITRFYIWFEQAINIIESFAFRPWLNLYIIYIYH